MMTSPEFVTHPIPDADPGLFRRTLRLDPEHPRRARLRADHPHPESVRAAVVRVHRDLVFPHRLRGSGRRIDGSAAA